MTKEEVLEKLLKKLKEQIHPITYTSLLKDIKINSMDDNEIIITIDSDNEMTLKSIEMNYSSIIEEDINEITNDTYDIKYIQYNEIKKLEKKEQIINNIEKNENLKLEEDVLNFKYSSNFNKNYTFENFAVGDSNKLAYTTALKVAQNPGKEFNPYFLYAKSGLGKTHLMHAIGNYILEHSDKRVLYVTMEQFMQDFRVISNIKGLNGNNLEYINAFRDKYRNIDVLIIDDIQMLEKYTKTQTEFFNTFNTLYDSNKQIIMASDRSVNDFKTIEERLKTRFKGGLTEYIKTPELDVKKNIILYKMKQFDFEIELSDEIIDFIANNCGANGRELDGAVKRLFAYKASFPKEELTMDLVKNILQEYVDGDFGKNNTISKILSVVAKYYGLEVSMIKVR